MLKRSVHIVIIGLLALPGFAAAAGVVQLPATNQTSCFDANGIQRNCAGTGEDGDNQAGVAWPTPRFDVKNDGTVKDKLTGLVWSRHANAPSRALTGDPPYAACLSTDNVILNPETDMLWEDALDYITCLNTNKHAGSKDWRLPNLNELESMLNAGVTDTSAYLNSDGFGFGAGLPSQVRASQYWTSTSDAGDVDFQSAAAAWELDLFKGDSPLSSILKNGKKNRVWPVRGESTGPAQLWRTGQTVCFNDVGDSRPCTDGEKPTGAVWPVPRFRTNAGATLAFDRLTGLVWTVATLSPGPSANPAGCNTGTNLTWQEALDHVTCLNTNAYLGRSDWRLPNRKELRSLADYSTGGPALPVGHPFDDPDGLTYWSSTTNAAAPKNAWVARMLDGSLSSAAKGATLPVWPVSGPDLVLSDLTITQGNMTTKTPIQTISGTVEAGATVTVTNNGGAPAAATVAGATWSFTINPLAAGMNAITVTAADFSENKKTASISITLDAVAPALAINPVADRTNKKSMTITGTLEAGATVAANMGTTALPLTVSGNTWSCPVTGLAAGANTFTITATDAVGNVTSQAATITFNPPDGVMSGGSAAGVGDALKALRIAVGIIQPSADDLLHGDVAPAGAPDDKIDVNDALLILRKAVGLPSF
jgi:hypothetical protein